MMNEKFSQLIGIKREKLLRAKPIKIFLPADEAARVFWTLDNAVTQNQQAHCKRRDRYLGQRRRVRRSADHQIMLPQQSRGKKFIIGFITDVASLRRAEGAELKKLHASLRAILESSKNPYSRLTAKGHYSKPFNKHHQETTRSCCTAPNIKIGGNKVRYLKDHHPDAKWVKAELQRAFAWRAFC